MISSLKEEFFFLVLSAEVAILFLLIAAILLRRCLRFVSSRIELHRKRILSAEVTRLLETGSLAIAHPHQFRHFSSLLQTLEGFEKKLQGGDWETLKEQLARRFLLPKARKYNKSFFWANRNLAARCFVLCPLQEDENRILKLLGDRAFLVRAVAASAAVRLDSWDGILHILKQMASERGYAFYFLCDRLSRCSTKRMVEIARLIEGSDEPMHLTILQVLSKQTNVFPLPFLHKDLQSASHLIRAAALKVVLRSPQKEYGTAVQHALKDPVEEVRALAAQALKNYPDTKTSTLLEQALTDSCWEVRYQAALSLKALGFESILTKASNARSPLAAAAAVYAMEFD